MSAVGLVMWLMRHTRVFLVTRDRIASAASSAERMGKGNSVRTTVAPRLRAIASALFWHARYSCVLTSTSSPGSILRFDSATATPVVALGTNTRSLGSHPTSVARSVRAASRAGVSRSTKNRTGSDSMPRRHSVCTSSTSVGHAPYEPWFRKHTLGSSPQREKSGDGSGSARAVGMRTA